MAQDSDIQDAYQAFKAYKAFKAQKSKVDPDAADKAAQLGMKDNAQATLNQGKAAAEGAAQGLTLSNVGNIGGAVQSLMSYLGKPGQVDRGLESQGFKIEQPSAFQAGKDATNRELDNSYKENPWSYRAGYVGGSLPLAGPAGSIAKAAGGGLEGAAAVGGAQGYLHDYDVSNPDRQLSKGLFGMAAGAAGNKAASSVGSGLQTGADWLQQKAMGVKKYIPGVGSEAIDAGIRGSRDSMADQMDSAIQNSAETAGEAIGKLGRIDSAQAAKPLQNYSSGLKVGGILPEHSASEFAGAGARGAEVAARGEVPAMDAWKLAQKAGQAGFRNQKALQSESAYLAQLEQQGYSNAIKEQFAKENPGVDNAVAEQFAKMGRLYKGQAALNTPETIRQGLPLTQIGATAVGTAIGGGPGAVAGFLAAKAAKSPAVQSYGAKALDMAGNGVESLANPETGAVILNSLFGTKSK